MTEDRDERLDEIIAEFLQKQEAGEPQDPATLIAVNPDFAREIREFFADQQQMQGIARPLANPMITRRPVLDTIRYFGDYELLEEIARGGMGVVYRARQVTLNRIVAVKMILAGRLASDDDVKRFQTEAESAGNLTHPNIVAVHEVGRHDGQSYFSMDFVDGKNLSEIVREKPLPAKTAAGYTRQIAEAVHFAHQQGTLHRDLKPSNILIDPADAVQITDFGLAMRVEGNSELTRTGQILGTPSYMSPEQAQNKRGLIGPGSDIYSLGAILYELLTGRPPFRAESAVETLRQVVETGPLSPRLLSPAVPRDVETICLKCLQKEPHKRYATAEQLADDLRRFLHGEPIFARPIGRPARLWRWCKRKPAVAGMIAVSLLAVVGAIIGLSISNAMITNALDDRTEAVTQLQDQQRVTGKALKEKELALGAKDKALGENARLIGERERALQREARGRKQAEATAYRSLVREARALRLARLPGYRNQAWARLKQALAIDTPERDVNLLRQEAVACMGDFVGGDPVVWAGRGRMTGNLSIFLDSRRVALALPGGIISICMIENQREVARLMTGTPRKRFDIADVNVAPDGRHIVVVNRIEAAEVWREESPGKWNRVASRGPTRSRPERFVTRARFFPDSRRYALSSLQGKAITIRGTTDPELDAVITRPNNASIGLAAISPDGRRLAAAMNSTSVGIWNLATGKLERQLQTPMKLILETAFTPDGKKIVVAADDGVVTYETSTYSQWSIVRLNAAFSLAFSPKSPIMAFGTMSKSVRLWNMNAHREIAILAKAKGANSYDSVAISPDGRWLFSASRSDVRLWRLRGLSETQLLHGHTEAVPRVAFSRDGKWLVSGSKDKTAKVWDVETGKLLQTFRVKGLVQSVAFSPDRRLLAIGEYFPSATISIWDLESRQRLATEQLNKRYLYHLDFTSGGKSLICAGYGLTIFDVRSDFQSDGSPAVTLTLKDTVRGFKSCFASISPNDEWVVWVDKWNTLRLWSLLERRELRHFSDDSLLLLGWHNVSFLPDGRHVVFVANNGKPQVWDAATGKMAYELSLTRSFEICGNALSPDGRRLAVNARLGGLTIVDIPSRREFFSLGPQASPIKSAAWSPDGKKIGLGLADGGVVIWNFASIRKQLTENGLGWIDADWRTHPALAPKPRPRFELVRPNPTSPTRPRPASPAGPRGKVTSLSRRFATAVFSPDGKSVATIHPDKSIRIVDPVSGRTLQSLRTGPKDTFDVQFSPDGTSLATAGYDAIRLWNLKTAKRIRVLREAKSRYATRVCFSPDGIRIAGAHSHGVAIWEVRTGKRLHHLNSNGGMWSSAAVFSPDGRFLATSRLDGIAKIWNTKTGKEVFSLKQPLGRYSVAFSPDGTRLATVVTGRITVWDWPRNKKVCQIRDGLYTAAFSANGKWLLGTTRGNEVVLWHAVTGDRLHAFPGHAATAFSAAFSPDGRHVVSNSADGKVAIWNVPKRFQATTLTTDDRKPVVAPKPRR